MDILYILYANDCRYVHSDDTESIYVVLHEHTAYTEYPSTELDEDYG